MLTRRFYQFGPFRIDAEKRVLLREGEVLPLKPKAFDTLLALVQHHGEVLAKDDLMEMLWPNSDVEESNLPLHISALRKTLGESPNERRYIVTVPGRGYRFAAEVEEFDDECHDLIVGRYMKSTLSVQDREASSDEAGRSLFAPDMFSNRSRLIFASLIVFAICILLALGFWRLFSNDSKGQNSVQDKK